MVDCEKTQFRRSSSFVTHPFIRHSVVYLALTLVDMNPEGKKKTPTNNQQQTFDKGPTTDNEQRETQQMRIAQPH
jgi:hypothetical protein